jgi:NhaP-type Na+/H+ or K+/H+ antiporter
MAYCGQTVLFILLGTISGIEAAKYDTLTSSDYIKMLLFWVMMIIVRAIVIYSFYPVLQSRGYGLSRRELVILIYGGLKGGLGLSLAMMITVDPYYPTRYRQLATLYMEGMVIMTVLINGLTCKKVVEYVEMIHVPQIKLKLLKKCIK